MKKFLKNTWSLLAISILATLTSLVFVGIFYVLYNVVFPGLEKIHTGIPVFMVALFCTKAICSIVAAVDLICCYISGITYMAIVDETKTIFPRMRGVKSFILWLKDPSQETTCAT